MLPITQERTFVARSPIVELFTHVTRAWISELNFFQAIIKKLRFKRYPGETFPAAPARHEEIRIIIVIRAWIPPRNTPYKSTLSAHYYFSCYTAATFIADLPIIFCFPYTMRFPRGSFLRVRLSFIGVSSPKQTAWNGFSGAVYYKLERNLP